MEVILEVIGIVTLLGTVHCTVYNEVVHIAL